MDPGPKERQEFCIQVHQERLQSGQILENILGPTPIIIFPKGIGISLQGLAVLPGG
jgi:hypothetical protein